MKPQDRVNAIRDSRLESSARIVLVVIASYMNDEHLTCWPSLETIAAGAGLCERQARDVLDSLQARGLIRRWSGEHKSRDIAIQWSALADAAPPQTARGGKRQAKTAGEAAKTATISAKTAGDVTGKDCHPDRQSLPPQPAKTATLTGKDCPRTVQEPTMEPTMEPTTARARNGTDAMILRAVEAIRQRPVNPSRIGTDSKTILGLWVAEGKPDPAEFGADLVLVIAWARESPDPLAARDIRAEGWVGGTDRHRDLATICRRDRWGARLDAARRWDERGRRPADRSAPPRASPPPSNRIAAAEADRQARTRRLLAESADPFAPALTLTGEAP